MDATGRAARDHGHDVVAADALAHALLAALLADADCVRRLAEAVAELDASASGAEPPAYTVERLAEVVGISPRAVRNAITRGELQAVKRGGRWLIAHDAVETWTRGDLPIAPVRRLDARRTATPRRSPLRDALVRLDRA